ncbi:MAG: coproporphyrinogen III oxidase family protein, partial [Bacteroidales bacterium]|nr:coproporphyrinogen III oxidase family protein [Bacteroidales bacterium]
MIYIHVPFCRSFCTYCDFYSEIAPKKECGSTEAFVDAVLEEAESRKEELSSPSPVNTLYIGGGTPSVLPLDVLSRLVQGVSSYTNSPFGEFTIEVNPEDIVEKGEGYVRGFVQLGVSRVSMGIQSFDDGILKWMNRRHDSSRAGEAFRILRSGGIGNISVDLIFGLSQLSDETWIQTIEKTLALEPEHISAYQLSIEEGSALGELVVKGKYSEAGEDLCRRQYDILCSRLKAAGYHHYEISNFAKPGYEAV